MDMAGNYNQENMLTENFGMFEISCYQYCCFFFLPFFFFSNFNHAHALKLQESLQMQVINAVLYAPRLSAPFLLIGFGVGFYDDCWSMLGCNIKISRLQASIWIVLYCVVGRGISPNLSSLHPGSVNQVLIELRVKQ